MIRTLAAATAALALALAPSALTAQDAKPKVAAAAPAKASKDEKVCRVKFPDGQIKTWVCHKDAACCSWDEAKYVRCGTAIGCLVGTAPIR